MADFYGALVEAFKIAEFQDDDDDDDDDDESADNWVEQHDSMHWTRDRIVHIIRELAESEKGRAGVVAAGALLEAFMIEISRSDGLIASLRLAKTILKLSESVEGRAGLVAAGGCGALAEASRINERDFEIFGRDCLQDFWDIERCVEDALRNLRNSKK